MEPLAQEKATRYKDIKQGSIHYRFYDFIFPSRQARNLIDLLDC